MQYYDDIVADVALVDVQTASAGVADEGTTLHVFLVSLGGVGSKRVYANGWQ